MVGWNGDGGWTGSKKLAKGVEKIAVQRLNGSFGGMRLYGGSLSDLKR